MNGGDEHRSPLPTRSVLQQDIGAAEVTADLLVDNIASAAAYGGLILRRDLPDDLQNQFQRFADGAEESGPWGDLAQYWEPLPVRDAAVMATRVAGALPFGPLAERIAADAASLAGALVRAVGDLEGATLTVGLEVVGTVRCRRWHVDRYIGRMTVTYGVHSGTIFIDDADANREAVLDSTKTNADIVPDETKAFAAPPGSFAFIKGTKWPGLRGGAVIHRSPDVPVNGGVLPHRLLLKVDIQV